MDLVRTVGQAALGQRHLAGYHPILSGLIHAEIARVDISLSAVIGIHDQLVKSMIELLGSERQPVGQGRALLGGNQMISDREMAKSAVMWRSSIPMRNLRDRFLDCWQVPHRAWGLCLVKMGHR